MPSKKKKYNARFPAGRIKKIMQTDEEVGKVAQAVPVIISRTLELFVESLLTKSMQITQSRNAKTLTPSHMKQCILSESRFDFLKDLVKNIPDASVQEDNENNAIFEANLGKLSESESDAEPKPQRPRIEPPALSLGQQQQQLLQKPISEIAANFYTDEQSTSTSRTPVIQFMPKLVQVDSKKSGFATTPPTTMATPVTTINHLTETKDVEPKLRITIGAETVPVPSLIVHSRKAATSTTDVKASSVPVSDNNTPPLIPISHNYYGQNTDDNLCIDEDYDN